jgi:MYXO-CTERM domain-containing protein
MARSVVLISSAAAFATLAYAANVLAVDCFIDSVNGDDTKTGLSEAQAVKTQAKIPSTCTVARFKRGSVFNESVKVSSKITTYTNYGNCSDPLPKFTKQRSTNNGSMFQAYSGNVTIDGLYLGGSMSDASMTNLMNGVCVFLGGNSKLLNSEITNCDIGIMLSGSGSLVQGNYIHDLYISVDAAPGVDPNAVGGAEGIFVNGSNNEVSYNAFIGCRASAQWTGGSCDGGATEVTVGAGGTVSGVKIHHNFSYQSCGFFEVSSGSGSSKGVFKDSEFYDNVSVDSGWLMLLQVNNTDQSNIKWDNNTVVQRSGSLNAGMLVTVFTGTSSGVSGGSLAQDVVSMTNNLVVFDGVSVYGTPIPSAVKQTTNLIINTSSGSPGFKNLSGSTAADFDLVSGSPAIDKGSASGRLLDFLNRTAPAGSAMDVGAFEYGAALAAGMAALVPPKDAVNGCATGGTTGTGGSATGGATSTGGTNSPTGGTANASGGTATGGTSTVSGGQSTTGGSGSSTGGTQSTTGGTQSTTGGSGGTAGSPENCSCRTAGESSTSERGPVGLLVLAASAFLRRRRPRKC